MADKEKFSRREFFIAMGVLALGVASCTNEYLREITTPTIEPTGTSGILNPGETVTLTSTLRPSDSPVPSETMTPTPRESCLIDGTVFTENNRHPDGGYRYPTDMSKIDKPLNEWTQAEKTTIVDAAGNPIYDGVRAIANSRWVSDNQLNYGGTWIGRECGYGLMFNNIEGNKVWATNVLGMAMGRPDGNGMGIGVQSIPNPGIEGHLELIVGREQTVVWVRGSDQIIGRYNPVTQTWSIEQVFRVTETPVNPANDVARNLGYENCPDCTLIKDPGVNTEGLLKSQTEGVLGYYDYNHERWTSTRGWKDVITQRIGGNWENYLFPVVRSAGTAYLFTLVTDGELLTQPFEVKTKDGEVLATARVSIRGFYMDKAGNLQSVIFPQLVKLPNEKLYLIRAGSYEDWNDTQLEEQIRSSPKLFNGGNRGLITLPRLIPDVQEEIRFKLAQYNLASLPEAFNYYLTQLDGFNRSWSQELTEFYRDGTPGEIIFPGGISFGDVNPILLPND